MATSLRLNGAALRAIRSLSGMSVTALAEAAGIGQSHLSNLEAGRRNASPEIVMAFARTLQVPVQAILANPDAWDEAA